ncbi:hypothetical protein [Pseudomonas putida]|uniref:Uncharacterized protein n=1 Tax=Pseudomonas putida TaxID=303 RepID=A0A1L7NPY1_PSEPU|nr:hypothetical protein [Pseudomonas putida]BAW27529.1 Uncharacterized protein KF715C_pC960 [Pseudomonas putida]
MSTDDKPLSLNSLVALRRSLDPEPAKRHRTTIYRAAKRLVAAAEGSSAGVYWTPEQIAAWHPEDFDQLCERVVAAGVMGMDIRGELNFSCDP